MAHEILSIESGLIRARVSGVMDVSDQEALQRAAVGLIQKGQKVRLLVSLESFLGWARKDNWDDIGFLVQHGDAIEKMAIVGEPRWRDEVYLFVGKGFRSTDIQYFADGSLDAAEFWVGTD